jgi:hypothetical protein
MKVSTLHGSAESSKFKNFTDNHDDERECWTSKLSKLDEADHDYMSQSVNGWQINI